MLGMALDSIQQTTRTPSTTSLAKTGSQKSELLDGFSPGITPSNANTSTTVMTPPVITPPVKFSLFNDTPHEENLPRAYLYTIDLIIKNTCALCHALSIFREKRLFQDQHAMTLPITSVVSNHDEQIQPASFYYPYNPLDNTQDLEDHHACLISRSDLLIQWLKDQEQHALTLPATSIISYDHDKQTWPPLLIPLETQRTAMTAFEDNIDAIRDLHFERLISTQEKWHKQLMLQRLQVQDQ